MRFIVFSILLICLYTSCNEATIFSGSMTIDEKGWTYDAPASFSFDILKSTKQFAINLDIVHTKEYAYENLYLSINLKQADGKRLEEIISIPLVSKEGKWLGNSTSGKVIKRVTIYQDQVLQQKGSYEIVINQNSRFQNLRGISQIHCHVINQ